MMKFEALIKVFDKLSDATSKMLDRGSPEKLAAAVEELHSGTEESYDLMRTIIGESETLTDEEKVEKLRAIAEEERKTKLEYAKAIDDHSERSAQIALGVFKGVLTLGIGYMPDIIKRMGELRDSKKQELIEEAPAAIDPPESGFISEPIDPPDAEEPVIIEPLPEDIIGE